MFTQYLYRSVFSWIGTTIFIVCIVAVINQAFFGGHATSRKIAVQVEQQQRQMELEQAREEATKANLDEALVALQEAKLSYESAVVQAQQWETEIEPLQENATGKLVGFDEEMVDHMAYLFNQERPSSEELQESLENVNGQLAAISVADGVSQSQLDSFQELRRNAVVSRRDWEQAVQSAEAIVRQSRRSVVGPESESTAEGDGESADLGEQMEQAHDQQLLIELEARRQAEQQLWQAEMEAEAERIRMEAERAEAKRILIEDAHSPEVQGVCISSYCRDTCSPNRLAEPWVSGRLRSSSPCLCPSSNRREHCSPGSTA